MNKEQVDNLLKAVFEKVDDDTEVKVINMTKHDNKNVDDVLKHTAENHKKLYDAHVAAGFNEEQAFIILTHMIDAMGK